MAPTKFSIRNDFSSTDYLGLYIVTYTVTGTAAALTDPTITCVNCVLVNAFSNMTTSTISNSGSTATKYVLQFIFVYTDPQQIPLVTFSGGSLPTSLTAGDLVVAKLTQ